MVDMILGLADASGWAAPPALVGVTAAPVAPSTAPVQSRAPLPAQGEAVATIHRPHPAKEAKKYQVDDARNFLTSIGVTP